MAAVMCSVMIERGFLAAESLQILLLVPTRAGLSASLRVVQLRVALRPATHREHPRVIFTTCAWELC